MARVDWRTPLFGRTAAIDALRKSRARAVLIIGEPGVGKSRLLAEARRRGGRRQAINVRCIPEAADLPGETVSEIARSLHRVGRISRPALRNISKAVEADRRSYFREALECAVQQHGILIQVDDIQWCDARSATALIYCVDRLRDLPIHWQFAARCGYETANDFGSALCHRQVGEIMRLEGLAFTDFAKLAQAICPGLEAADGELTTAYQLTNGNPLYSQLLLTSRAAQSPTSQRELDHLLRDRIKKLAWTSRKVAGCVALARRPLLDDEIVGLCEITAASAATAFDQLTDAGVLCREKDSLVFRHELLRDACQKLMPPHFCVKIHSALADRTPRGWDKVSHLVGAGRDQEALNLLIDVGWEKLEYGLPHEALKAFEQATSFRDADSQRLWEAKAGAAAARHLVDRSLPLDALAPEVAHGSGQVSRAVRCLVRIRIADALLSGVIRAQAIPRLLEDAELDIDFLQTEIQQKYYLVYGITRVDNGTDAQAFAAFKKSLALAGASNSLDTLRARVWQSVIGVRVGEAIGGLQEAERAAEDLAARGFTFEFAGACSAMCAAFNLVSDPNRRHYWSRRGLDAPGPKLRRTELALWSWLAGSFTYSGELEKAAALSVRMLPLARELSNDIGTYFQLLNTTQNHAMLGRFMEARSFLQEAKIIHDSRNVSPFEKYLDFVYGFLQECEANFEPALDRYLTTWGDGAAKDKYHLGALSGVIRVGYALKRRPIVEWGVEQLRNLRDVEWPLLQQVRYEAEGFFALARGDIDLGCEQLEFSVKDSGTDPFEKARLLLWIADARADGSLFAEVVRSCDKIGALCLSEQARSLARSRGYRIGRRHGPNGGLSERERSVALLVAAGSTNAEIASSLRLSPKTVEHYLHNILSKYGLRSRVQIALMAVSGGSGFGSQRSVESSADTARDGPERAFAR